MCTKLRWFNGAILFIYFHAARNPWSLFLLTTITMFLLIYLFKKTKQNEKKTTSTSNIFLVLGTRCETSLSAD